MAQQLQAHPSASGQRGVVYELPAGIYTYKISAQNEAGTKLWKEVTGNIVVKDAAQTVTVKLAEYARDPSPWR